MLIIHVHSKQVAGEGSQISLGIHTEPETSLGYTVMLWS